MCAEENCTLQPDPKAEELSGGNIEGRRSGFVESSKAPEAARIRKDRDWVDFFEIVSRFILTLAATIIAVSTFLHANNEQKSGEVDQIRSKFASAEFSRRALEAQVSNELAALAIHGSGVERRSALIALMNVAPSTAKGVASALLQNENNSGDKDFLRKILLQSSLFESNTTFLSELAMAREFLRRQHPTEACGEFLRARDQLTTNFSNRVDSPSEKAGQLACMGGVAGHPEEGAKAMQEAFKKIQSE